MCDDGELLMKLTINPDQFPEEISFQVLDITTSQNGIVILQGGYPGNPVQVMLWNKSDVVGVDFSASSNL